MKVNLIPILIFFISFAIYFNFIYPYISSIDFADQVILYRNPKFTIPDLFIVIAICSLSISTYAMFPKVEKEENIEPGINEIKMENPWFVQEAQEPEVERVEDRIEEEIRKDRINGETRLEDIIANAILTAARKGGVSIDSSLTHDGELEILGKKFRGDFRVSINTSKTEKVEKEKAESKKEVKREREEEFQVV